MVTPVYVPSVRQTERSCAMISLEVARWTENSAEGDLILDSRSLATL